MAGVSKIFLLSSFLSFLTGLSNAIMFHIQPNTQKCLREEIHKNVLVYVEFAIQEAIGQKVDIRVRKYCRLSWL